MEGQLPRLVDEEHVEDSLPVGADAEAVEHSVVLAEDLELVGDAEHDAGSSAGSRADLRHDGDVVLDPVGQLGAPLLGDEQADRVCAEDAPEPAGQGDHLLVRERGHRDPQAVRVGQGLADHAHQRVGLAGAGGRAQQDLVVRRGPVQRSHERVRRLGGGGDVGGRRRCVVAGVVRRCRPGW